MKSEIRKILLNVPLFSILFILFLSSLSFADTNISTCSNLNVTGETFLLTADIINSGNTTCMSILQDDITLNCQGYTIDGVGTLGTKGVYSLNSANTTVKNCVVTQWDDAGIWVQGQGNHTIINNTINSNTDVDIYFQSANNNLIANNTMIAGFECFELKDTADSTITGNNMSSCTRGLAMANAPANNLIYNNYFFNTQNVDIAGGSAFNDWNTTKTLGTNIIGGKYLGGNAFYNSTGGFSAQCINFDYDGICDDSLIQDGQSNNQDFLPLADHRTPRTPIIIIDSPQNITYRIDSVDLNFSINTMDTNPSWEASFVNYSLDGGTRQLAFRENDWQDTPAIISGLVKDGDVALPEIFYMDGTWYAITGHDNRNWNGYNWTGSAWQNDSAIVSGLYDVGSRNNEITIFNINGTWYAISGEQDGVFNGWNWTGSAWQNDSAIVSGLTDVGFQSAPTTFKLDGNWYLISGEEASSNINSWKFNISTSTWAVNTSIKNGLIPALDTDRFDFFQKDGTWYALSQTANNNIFFGYNWTGSAWQNDSAIANGLVQFGVANDFSVFELDGTLYIIRGNLGGDFSGANITYATTLDSLNETTHEVTVYARNKDGVENSSTVYFTFDELDTQMTISDYATVLIQDVRLLTAEYQFIIWSEYEYPNGTLIDNANCDVSGDISGNLTNNGTLYGSLITMLIAGNYSYTINCSLLEHETQIAVDNFGAIVPITCGYCGIGGTCNWLTGTCDSFTATEGDDIGTIIIDFIGFMGVGWIQLATIIMLIIFTAWLWKNRFKIQRKNI